MNAKDISTKETSSEWFVRTKKEHHPASLEIYRLMVPLTNQRSGMACFLAIGCLVAQIEKNLGSDGSLFDEILKEARGRNLIRLRKSK